MTDIEKRLEQVERFVELILVAHANPYDSLLNVICRSVWDGEGTT